MTSAVFSRSRPAGRKRRRWLDWMAIPTIVVLGVVIGYPIVEAIQVSFFHYNLVEGAASARYIGGSNYQSIIHDPTFWESLQNTSIFTFASVAGSGLVGLALALATENLQGRWRWLRGILLTPWAIPVIVVSFLFRYMFDDYAGVVNALLMRMHIIGGNVHWLTSGRWSLTAVTVANIWSQAPFFLLIFTAALGGVPTAVLEAARIDRAGVWATITRIKLPYLTGAAVTGALIMIIQNFNNFPLIWSMTEGGPGYSTTTLVIYVYRLAFSSYDLGYASAIGVVWLVLLLLLSVLFIRTLRGERR